MLNKIGNYIMENKFKTLMIAVFIFPILPLSFLAVLVLIGGAVDMISNGLRYSSVSQVLLQLLWFGGGVSGFAGGLMVIFNRINVLSTLLFLHGAISYSSFVVLIAGLGSWKSALSFYSLFLLFTVVVVAIQFVLIVKKLIADEKPENPTIKPAI